MSIILSFGLLNCDNSPTNSAGENHNYFPRRIGSVWVYERYDPFYTIYDTVVDSMTKMVSDSFGHFYAEIKESSYFTKGVYHYYQRVSGDSVIVFAGALPRDSATHRDKLFILPFDSGRIWQNNWSPDFGQHDTFRVVGFENANVPYGSFHNSVHIHRFRWFLNDYFTGDYWFVDGIGIVKKYERDYVAWTYDLISYREPRHANRRNRDSQLITRRDKDAAR